MSCSCRKYKRYIPNCKAIFLNVLYYFYEYCIFTTKEKYVCVCVARCIQIQYARLPFRFIMNLTHNTFYFFSLSFFPHSLALFLEKWKRGSTSPFFSRDPATREEREREREPASRWASFSVKVFELNDAVEFSLTCCLEAKQREREKKKRAKLI